MERVAVVGVGQTRFSAARVEATYADLVYEAAASALADAGLGMADIDNVVTVSNDFWDGRTISSMAVGDAAGAAFGAGKNVSTVEGDGAFGAFYGLARILSGAYRSTLVVAHSKASEGDPRLITNALFDPVYERSLGLDDVTAAALQARACIARRGHTRRLSAEAVVQARADGAKNPNAQLRSPVTLEEVLSAEPVADPIGALDAAPRSDGAAAVVLAGEGLARKARHAAWVEGVAFAADPYHLGDRDLSEAPALRAAAKKACRMAGLDDPAKELEVAEVSDVFSYQRLLWREELGLALPGGSSEVRINPSGGCLAAHAVVAAGLVRIVEAALQLRGAAANQVDGVRRALAHGQSGLCGQSHCVWILGRG